MTAIVQIVFLLIIALVVMNLHKIKDFQAFNSWLILFVCLLFIFPFLSGFLFIENFLEIVKELPFRTLRSVVIPSLFGGVSLFLLFSTIRKNSSFLKIILFIIAALLAFGISLSVPIIFWIFPIALAIVAVILKKWGISSKELGYKEFIIPILAGFTSIGFVKAFQVEPHTISDLVLSFGNDNWQVLLFQMLIILIGSGIFIFPIFLAQMGQKNAWIFYDTPFFWRNIWVLTILSIVLFLSVFLIVFFSLS